MGSFAGSKGGIHEPLSKERASPERSGPGVNAYLGRLINARKRPPLGFQFPHQGRSGALVEYPATNDRQASTGMQSVDDLHGNKNG